MASRILESSFSGTILTGEETKEKMELNKEHENDFLNSI